MSDEDDCSTPDRSIFAPPQFLTPRDPLEQQGLNVRCFYNAQRLYPVQRYVEGLRALREGAD